MEPGSRTPAAYALVAVSLFPTGVRLDLDQHAPVFIPTGNVEVAAQVEAMSRLEVCWVKLGSYPDGRLFAWVCSQSWSFTLVSNPAFKSA